MKRFEGKPVVISGKGAVSALKELGAKRLLVVTDPYFYENGMAQRIGAASEAEQIQYFSKVQPDPTVELAAEGTGVMKEFMPDALVALGGGSAMDCAKAMLYFSGLAIPFAAIPTTSGSGSEVTDFAILTHKGVKHPLVDQRLRPTHAILDSQLLEQLPKKLIADAGFDVLSHALEAYVATNSSMITDALAKDAFATVYALLSASYAGNRQVRLQIHTAATMAGMAFTQAGLGLCHAMAHALGGMFHVPHGRLNAILLPAVIGCNSYSAADRYAQIAGAAGMGGSAKSVAVRNLKNGLIRLRRELDMPATLMQAGINPGQVMFKTKELVEAVLSDPCCATNPIGVEEFMVRGILEEVTGHG